MIRAGIDIGTNTILLLIADVDGGRISRVLEDHVRVVRLGQGVDQFRAFQPAALERARACFREYAEILAKYPGVPCRAVATSGSRDAKNSAEFFQEVKRDFGIPVEVISGEEEARLSFLGSVPEGTELRSVAVLDIGGGSTEIVGMGPGEELFRFSFDVGCVRMTERFLHSDPPVPQELTALRDYLRGLFSAKRELFAKVRGRRLIGVAGTATYLASSDQDLSRFLPERVQGYVLPRKHLQALLARFQNMKAAERLGVGGMDRGRADVIVAGAIILEEVLEFAELDGVWVSTRGLRYGAVLG